MPNTELTQEQARQLADGYLDLARAVRKYRDDNFGTLNEEQRKRLRNFTHQLLNEATELTERSIVLTLSSEDTAQAVTNLSETTEKMKKAIKSLNNINKILAIATAAIELGVAIASGNPTAILEAIGAANEATS